MNKTKKPLAFAMRPTTLEEVVGQQHLIGDKQILRKCVENEMLFSMIFYGPPGTGKTTLASVLSHCLHKPYRMFNAVSGNKKELDAIFFEAKMQEGGLVVIVDEVHRLNKDKQDLLLPHMENGDIIMIGATTANPYHAINPAIRSRCHLFEVKALSLEDIVSALHNALQSDKGLNAEYTADEDALQLIAKQCNGDIRFALNILEICALASESKHLDIELVSQYAQIQNRSFDKDGDGYYNLLSAFQKSIRGSDVDAALYYLAQLIEAGDMISIERRLLVTAYEDIGLGNPSACARCINAIDAAKRVGFPEGRIPLALAIIDLCLSPKSKSAEAAIDSAMRSMRQQMHPMPSYLHFTPVEMKEEDKYDYGREDLFSKLQYLPNAIKHMQFYFPSDSSQYEKVLSMNYQKLKKTPRTSNISSLNIDKK